MAQDKLLSRIHKNAQTGIFISPVVAEMTENAEMQHALRMQQTEYKNIFYSAERLTNRQSLINLSPLAKKRTEAMVKLSALLDKSDSHFAEMMILGSTRGVIDMHKALTKYTDAPPASRELAHTLLEVEQKNIDRLKQYL